MQPGQMTGAATASELTAGNGAEVGVRPGRRLTESITVAAVSVALVIFAFTLKPCVRGDGALYVGMLEGLARNHSPALTDEVRAAVRERTGAEPAPALIAVATNGRAYGKHFFAYPLACLPAYWLLQALGADVLKAFQLTNALFLAAALCYLLVFSRLPAPARWLAATGFFFSTGTLYLQWTHPEEFTAALVLVASVALLERRHLFSALIAAVGSLQNPSVALLILPIVGDQFVQLQSGCRRARPSRRAFLETGGIIVVSLIALAPYCWNFLQFGTFSPIGDKWIDSSNINLGRLVSFVFDLNQGLIVGLPLLLWTVPVALIFRLTEAIRDSSRVLRREDLLWPGFLLLAVPTLGQVNWNSDQSLFLRYASWAGMVPLVWSAVAIGGQRAGRIAAGLIPALLLQVSMALYLGGLQLTRVSASTEFRPWVKPIWDRHPHVYDPLPEIFVERLFNRGISYKKIPTPAILRGDNGEMLRILTRAARLDDVAVEVCGPRGRLQPLDQRHESAPLMMRAERGFHYLTGRLICRWPLPAVFSLVENSAVTPRRLFGWSSAEASGTWSLGSHSSFFLDIVTKADQKVGVHFVGQAFVNEQHPEQVIHVRIGGREAETWVIHHPGSFIDKMLPVDLSTMGAGGELLIEFSYPNAIAPNQLGLSDDSRQLALFMRQVSVEYLNQDQK